jgi:hypothetical protein
VTDEPVRADPAPAPAAPEEEPIARTRADEIRAAVRASLEDDDRAPSPAEDLPTRTS